MPYTNKQIAKVFRAAKKTLPRTAEDNDFYHISPYICDNIDMTNYDCSLKDAAANIIQERVGCFGVEIWLSDRGYIPDRRFNSNYSPEMQVQLQAYRHRWLDSLIKEFENKLN